MVLIYLFEFNALKRITWNPQHFLVIACNFENCNAIIRKSKSLSFLASKKTSSHRKETTMYDSFDKGWFVILDLSVMKTRSRKTAQRAHTYNMLENILRVEIPTQTVKEKMVRSRKERRKPLPTCFGRNGHTDESACRSEYPNVTGSRLSSTQFRFKPTRFGSPRRRARQSTKRKLDIP